MGCHALLGVDGEAALDKFACGERDGAPVFERREGVVSDKDGLHFFEVGVAVEGRVAAEQEVGYHTYCPRVAISCVRDGRVIEGPTGERTLAFRVQSC